MSSTDHSTARVTAIALLLGGVVSALAYSATLGLHTSGSPFRPETIRLSLGGALLAAAAVYPFARWRLVTPGAVVVVVTSFTFLRHYERAVELAASGAASVSPTLFLLVLAYPIVPIAVAGVAGLIEVWIRTLYRNPERHPS